MKKYFNLIAFALIISSCASTTQFVKFTGSSSEPSQGMAKIYVLRKLGINTSVKMPVYCNDEIMGKLGPNSYLCWEVSEGVYNLRSATEGYLIGNNPTENKDYFTINAKSGKSYYIQQTPKFNVGVAKATLDLLSESEGKRAVTKLKTPKINYAE